MDPVEALGIERARQKLQQADLVLFLLDAMLGLGPAEQELYQTIRDKAHIVVINKSDLAGSFEISSLVTAFPEVPVVSISAKHQQGIQELLESIYHSVVGAGAELCEQMTCAPNTRHKAILTKTLAACQSLEVAFLGGGTC